MTSPPSFSFSKPAMPGDAVSVLVLVEDSATMAAKWPDVRDSYLPKLLENLRSADPSVQMDARWLTTSSASAASPPVVVVDAAQAQMPVDVPLKREGCPTKFSPAVIANAISILSSASRRQNTTRHLILVAATGPLTQGPFNDTTPSGFDAWDDIAVVLKQQYMRLHVILSVGAEMRTYHELFKRSLQLQNNSEVPAWFSVDSNRYSIRLSGRPQYVRGSAALPIPLVPTAIPEDTYNDPTTPAPSPPSLSPPETASTPSSPSHSTSPGARKSSTSPTNIRTRHRGGDPPQSPPTTEGGGGLVSYLQQMHGLTKKKSYGIKAPKKTYADIRLPNAGRPILPRLEVPPSQSDIYTYPTFDNVQGTETQVPVAEPQLPPPRRHSVDQLPSASLVARTNNEDRRARRRGPWLPIAPPASSTPSSPTSTTSPGTLAALQSLASMTPRLPDFVTKDRTPPAVAGATDPRSAYPMPSLAASTPPPGAGYYANAVQSWQQQQASVVTSPVSAAPSPTHAVSSSTMSDGSRFRTSPPTPQLVGSDYTNGSSPPSSTAATPLSLSAPMGADSTEDQPFVVTPEYEAMVNARFDEAVRSGAMHASMTPAIRSAVPVSMSSAPPAPAYTSSLVAPVQEQSFYSGYSSAMPHAGMMDMHDTGYATYQSVHDMGEYPDSGDPANGVWEYPVAESYMPTMQEYTHAQGQWYAS
ncbi:hypothetical protein L226DRAFT_526184 [Lentinus tigrinus ALCF2SS1-7]|uniref:Uncharacterized protein n=1 Tax=Lentinus tigrinus ALCF2SS1-6 TaxID=1328759 RepID=A0A5C2RWX3_9APHY|nr:hypothetical protein L227DRAFT_510405 [Lentinus tigrinus ALCF2SS1-6]RPD70177.1 hypothetical protein L226DRAFT_526184 [Lentinus tigrinus ALCF2SS1-7]